MGKWVNGDRITDPLEAIAIILAGGFLFEGTKVQNHGWMCGWQLNHITSAVRRGRIFKAIAKDQDT